jgi:hypothetical protein
VRSLNGWHDLTQEEYEDAAVALSLIRTQLEDRNWKAERYDWLLANDDSAAWQGERYSEENKALRTQLEEAEKRGDGPFDDGSPLNREDYQKLAEHERREARDLRTQRDTDRARIEELEWQHGVEQNIATRLTEEFRVQGLRIQHLEKALRKLDETAHALDLGAIEPVPVDVWQDLHEAREAAIDQCRNALAPTTEERTG